MIKILWFGDPEPLVFGLGPVLGLHLFFDPRSGRVMLHYTCGPKAIQGRGWPWMAGGPGPGPRPWPKRQRPGAQGTSGHGPRAIGWICLVRLTTVFWCRISRAGFVQ